MHLVDCLNLVIGYKDQELVRIDKFALKGAQVYPLMGPNGCGKSTLLKTLAGFITPKMGHIQYFGQNAKVLSFERMAYLPEYNPLFDRLTVLEHLSLIPNKDTTYRIDTLLKSFDLLAVKDKYPSQLSAGQQRCLHLIALFLKRPTLLLLDEPTKELDNEHRAAFHRLVYDFVQKGSTCLFSTHLIDDLKGYPHVLKIQNKALIMETNQTQSIGVSHEDTILEPA